MKLMLTLLSGMLVVSLAHGQQDTSDLARPVFGGQVVNQPDGYDPNDPANRYNEYNGRGAGKANKITSGVQQTTNSAPNQATINPGAQTGEKSQSGGAGVNAAVGAALMAACLAPCPKCIMPLCAMGAMAFMQSGHDSGAAGKSHATFEASKNDTTSSNPTDPTGSGGFDQSKLDAAMAKLGEAGYEVKENGVRFPDGSFRSSTDLISPAAMQSAGLDPSTSMEAQAIVDDIISDATRDANAPRVTGVATNSAGGGGGGAGDGGGSSGDSSGGAGSYNPFSMNADEKKRLIAGKTVMFDGEPIGVRGNNIFDMVHQAYQKRRQGNQFIEAASNAPGMQPASVSAPTRSPASAAPTPRVFRGSNR